MKGIVLTPQNYKMVAGRLVKFFSHRDFDCWHQWDCGMKKRVGSLIFLGGPVTGCWYDTRREYHNIQVEWLTPIGTIPLLRIVLNESEILIFKPGDTVWFLGNRIVIKKNYGSGMGWCYETFQIANKED